MFFNFKKLSVLILTLLMISSCNISSSSSLNSSANGSIVDSSTTNINQVNSIVLTTTSSVKQFLGLNSRVIINASVNPNASTGVALDWFVNDEISLTQKGAIFEFTPTTVNTYRVYAKSGSIVSNTIEVELALPSFNVGQISAVSNNAIRLIGESGLSFQVTGLTVSPTSRYNFITQEYIVNLNNVMIQGNSYNIIVSKPGFNNITIPFVYETRKLTVSYISYNNQRVSPNADGAYELTKPFASGLTQNYVISLAHTNLEGTAVPFNVSTGVPAGAVAINNYQATVNVLKNININKDYPLTSNSTTGLYVHNIILGGVNLNVRILVVNPTPKVELGTPFIYDASTIVNPFAQDVDGKYLKPVIKPNAVGHYEIFKPYNGDPFEFTFIVRADNFVTPLGFPASPATPYNLLVALSGPSGGVMYYSNTANTLTTSYPFRESLGNNVVVSQLVDNKTQNGTYTYTFTATGSNVNVTRSVIVIVKEYQPKLTAEIIYNDEELKPNTDGSFTIFKPVGSNSLTSSLKAVVSNYESPLVSQGLQAGVDTYYESGSGLKYFLNYQVTYSGPLSSVLPLNTKLAVELGFSQGNAGITSVSSIENTPVTYPRHRGVGSEIEIDLNLINDSTNYVSTNIFAHMATINANTVPGTHIYTVTIGRLSMRIIFIIQQPSALLLLKADSVKYGSTLGGESVNNVELNKNDNKYYVKGAGGYLKLNVYPFGLPSGTYPYTFTVTTPSGSLSTTTNVVPLEIKTSPAYDGTLNYPQSGQGSEMNVSRLLDEVGEYRFSYNINGVIRDVYIVVLDKPALVVNNVFFNNQTLVNFNNAFYLNHSTVSRFLEIEVTPVNVEADYKYVINTTGLFPTGAALTNAKRDLLISGDRMLIGVELPARASATAEDKTSYYIYLYNGNVLVGNVTKVDIVSQPIKATIFFNSRGGSAVQAITKFVAESVAAPTPPILTNFSFGGWYLDEGLTLSYSFTNMPDKDVILYAKWNP